MHHRVLDLRRSQRLLVVGDSEGSKTSVESLLRHCIPFFYVNVGGRSSYYTDTLGPLTTQPRLYSESESGEADVPVFPMIFVNQRFVGGADDLKKALVNPDHQQDLRERADKDQALLFGIGREQSAGEKAISPVPNATILNVKHLVKHAYPSFQFVPSAVPQAAFADSFTPPSPSTRIMYDVANVPGVMVLGASYCGHTLRAVTALVQQRVPFYYVDATAHHEHYIQSLGKSLEAKTFALSDGEPRKGSPPEPYATFPTILLSGELVGGREQIQDVLLDPERTRQLLQKACSSKSAVVALPSDRNDLKEVERALQEMRELMNQGSFSVKVARVLV
jgi:glutaredoxin-related protein